MICSNLTYIWGSRIACTWGYDDVTTSFPNHWPFVMGIPWSGMQTFDVSFVISLNKLWTNSRVADDLKHHVAHGTYCIRCTRRYAYQPSPSSWLKMPWCQIGTRASATIMMTSWNGNIFRVTGHLCEEFTGHRWIPLTKASGAELWCFLWSVLE